MIGSEARMAEEVSQINSYPNSRIMENNRNRLFLVLVFSLTGTHIIIITEELEKGYKTYEMFKLQLGSIFLRCPGRVREWACTYPISSLTWWPKPLTLFLWFGCFTQPNYYNPQNPTYLTSKLHIYNHIALSPLIVLF